MLTIVCISVGVILDSVPGRRVDWVHVGWHRVVQGQSVSYILRLRPVLIVVQLTSDQMYFQACQSMFSFSLVLFGLLKLTFRSSPAHFLPT